MSDHTELIARFTSVTGVDAERATFYLESAAWNLDVAMGSFFDTDDNGGGDESGPSGPSQPEPPVHRVAEDPPPAKPAGRSSSGSSSRFATIGNLRQEESDSDDEDRQAFYAGGHEQGGGQQVLGDKKKKKPNTDELVTDMFKSAKEHGAEEVAAGPSSDRPAARPTFRGSGYRLGSTEDTSSMIAGAPMQTDPRQVDMALKLWKDGFSVGDGPLRNFQDPENKEFLESIRKGEVPRELLRLAKGGEVNLNMEDLRNEEYVKPKVALKAFTGEGHKLGSPAPTLTNQSPGASAAASPSSQSQGGATKQATVDVDSSKPTTSLQIRLHNGQRLVAKFNHSHTVADVRSYIITSHPELAGANFILQTTFPNKELTDESLTLESANLLNAVLVQRLK